MVEPHQEGEEEQPQEQLQQQPEQQQHIEVGFAPSVQQSTEAKHLTSALPAYVLT